MFGCNFDGIGNLRGDFKGQRLFFFNKSGNYTLCIAYQYGGVEINSKKSVVQNCISK